MLITKVRRFIGFIVYSIVDFIAIKKTDFNNSNSILIIRMDVLGDYILFRNFIEVLKKRSKYQDYKITFCGNSQLKELVEVLDKEFIDDFIWIDRDKFVLDIFYRFKILRDISLRSYTVAINPQFSREFFHSDSVIKAANARVKIGYDCDLNNQDSWQKKISDKFYTLLIKSNDEVLFEFYRNKFFFEKFLNSSIDIKKHYIKIDNILDIQREDSKSYVVICPGARVSFKRWSALNYKKVTEYIIDNYGMEVIFIGSRNEVKITQYIVSQLSKYHQINNLTGILNISELISIIKNAELVIGNDTGISHLSSALGTKTLVISNGNHYGRFFPYPNEISDNVWVVLPPELRHSDVSEDLFRNKYKYMKYYSDIDINKITVDDVKKAIDEIFYC